MQSVTGKPITRSQPGSQEVIVGRPLGVKERRQRELFWPARPDSTQRPFDSAGRQDRNGGGSADMKPVQVEMQSGFVSSSLLSLLSVITEAFVVYQRLVCSARTRRLPGIHHLDCSFSLMFFNGKPDGGGFNSCRVRKKTPAKERCDMLACNI